MKIHCPACEGVFRVEGQTAGADCQCPYCKSSFSFRDKDTVVAKHSPDTLVRVERETPTVAGAPPLAGRAAPSQPRLRVTPLPDPTQLTDLRVGDVVAGAYRLESIIGSGGMSVVFLARQLSLDRSVALKVLRKDLCQDREFSQRFLKEARALAELSHPNIVQVIDQGVHSGNHFLVMEHIDGASLREVLAERRLSPAEALRIVPALCAALEYAHGRGIIHRDIKPENLMLTRSGMPKIADFGLARMLGTHQPELTRLTRTQTILGTIDYMAPEQRAGQSDIDHRADIYSLGVVFYEMLTGDLPIARFPLPSERVQVDVRLDEVVLKVLERDREQRYQRASLIATDLQRIEQDPHGMTSARMPDRDTIVRRAGHLVQEPLFFFVSLVTLIILATTRADHVVCLAVGLYVPFLAVQLVRHGLLPRPAVSPEAAFVRHPMAFFGVLAVASLILGGVLGRDASLLLAGGFLSTGICLWRSRSWLLRPPHGPAFMPGLGPRTHGAAQSSSAHDSPPSPTPGTGSKPVVAAASPLAGGPGTGNGDIHAPPALPGIAGIPAGGIPAGGITAGDVPSPGRRNPGELASAGMPRENSPSPAPAAPRVRLSWLAALAFLLSLASLAYALTVSVGLSVLDWQTVAPLIDLRFHELHDLVVDGLWCMPASQLARVSTLLTGVLLLPPLLALGTCLLALIPLQSPLRRGGWLVSVALVLIAVQALLLMRAVQPLSRELRAYAAIVVGMPPAGNTIDESLVAAQLAVHGPTRLALMHYAVLHTRAGETVTQAGSLALIGLVRNTSLPALERMVALLALEEVAREELQGTGQESAAVLDACVAAAAAERQREVRCALLGLLERCPDERLREVYWLALRNADACGDSAVRWWTGTASLESIAWLGTRYGALDQDTLQRWVQRLERSKNPRFLYEPELRRALLEPLLELPNLELRHRIRQLIDPGPAPRVR